jgi:hypothetical protein
VKAAIAMAGMLLCACAGSGQRGDASFRERAVSALGGPDGYVLVFSPFNCTLTGAQIDAINALAARRRRSGIILAFSPSPADDSTAATAVARLGIRMTTRSLRESPLRDVGTRDGLRLPIAIAIRHGEVIAMTSGESAERLDSWLSWLEQRPFGTP